MLRITIFISLFLNQALAKTILISSFDAFDGAAGNSTEFVAKNLMSEFEEREDLTLVYCPLKTVYNESYQQLMDCMARMQTPPDYIISLGETGCRRIKYETRARNFMKDYSQDNNGVHYKGEPVIVGGKKSMPLTLDLKPYISKSIKMRRSTNAGTFVCNNLSYLMTYHQPELAFSFIHIPKYNCKNSKKKIDQTTATLKELLLQL